MDTFIKDAISNGKDVNEVLAMPYNFVLDILAEKAKPEEANSFFDLL